MAQMQDLKKLDQIMAAHGWGKNEYEVQRERMYPDSPNDFRKEDHVYIKGYSEDIGWVNYVITRRPAHLAGLFDRIRRSLQKQKLEKL